MSGIFEAFGKDKFEQIIGEFVRNIFSFSFTDIAKQLKEKYETKIKEYLGMKSKMERFSLESSHGGGGNGKRSINNESKLR